MKISQLLLLNLPGLAIGAIVMFVVMNTTLDRYRTFSFDMADVLSVAISDISNLKEECGTECVDVKLLYSDLLKESLDKPLN